MPWPQDAYVGQKVFCIFEGACPCGCGIQAPPQNTELTIGKITCDWIGEVGFEIVECPAPHHPWHEPVWHHRIFRPVQSTSRGMEILRRLQNPANHRVRISEDA